ncbi:glycosyltransferase family 2 protein [Spirulina subsalsa]|uniref:glycosyltransferase family 2 protein n=1 Tax=Spirulina subsalsa TaxID=54311 RepID=UPI00030EF76B|nr:glycosyltransferase family 2 protein [Spirulina subsalsa]
MSSTGVKLSIALVTRNRPESLNRCLETVRSQNCQPYEIVVSDDSDPDHRSTTQAIAEHWHCRYIPGPGRGLYANRNHVAFACLGTHIRTMDDDHILPPGHLAQCLVALEQDPFSIWTTGEIGYINGEYCATAHRANQLCKSGVGMTIENLDDNWGIADGSTIYPRVIFDQGLAMLEDYRYGSSYLEFGAYLYYHGFRSRCIPNAYIEHYGDEMTITRYNATILESYLYASLCFNLYFKRSYTNALKYAMIYLWKLRQDAPIFPRLTRILNHIEQRWGKAPIS